MVQLSLKTRSVELALVDLLHPFRVADCPFMLNDVTVVKNKGNILKCGYLII